MEHPAFDSRLAESDLAELGRLTVNFGYIELLLDWLIAGAYQLNSEALRKLVSPLSLEKKIVLLKERIDETTNDLAKSKLEAGLALISSVRVERNLVTHGYWAFNNGAGVQVFNRKKAKHQSASRDVGELADIAARASRLLYEGFDILSGKKPSTTMPDLLTPGKDGAFYIRLKGS